LPEAGGLPRFTAMTENGPILAELAAKLAEAETWEDESRERLGNLFDEMRVAFAEMAAGSPGG